MHVRPEILCFISIVLISWFLVVILVKMIFEKGRFSKIFLHLRRRFWFLMTTSIRPALYFMISLIWGRPWPWSMPSTWLMSFLSSFVVVISWIYWLFVTTLISILSVLITFVVLFIRLFTALFVVFFVRLMRLSVMFVSMRVSIPVFTCSIFKRLNFFLNPFESHRIVIHIISLFDLFLFDCHQRVVLHSQKCLVFIHRQTLICGGLQLPRSKIVRLTACTLCFLFYQCFFSDLFLSEKIILSCLLTFVECRPVLVHPFNLI